MLEYSWRLRLQQAKFGVIKGSFWTTLSSLFVCDSLVLALQQTSSGCWAQFQTTGSCSLKKGSMWSRPREINNNVCWCAYGSPDGQIEIFFLFLVIEFLSDGNIFLCCGSDTRAGAEKRSARKIRSSLITFYFFASENIWKLFVKHNNRMNDFFQVLNRCKTWTLQKNKQFLQWNIFIL